MKPAARNGGAPHVPPWFDVGVHRVQLLRDGVEAFPAMLEAIRGATREVLLEMYWIGDDECGLRFRDALVERARAGVVVRVVWDSLGSLTMSRGFWEPLVRAGGEAHEFHPILPLARELSLERIERRDHRKLLVVDDTIGFTGGINLSKEWLPLEEGGSGWRDDAVAVVGPAASELRSLFYETWRRAARKRGPRDVPPIPRRRSRFVWVLANDRKRRRGIRREYLARIGSARKSVDIANSYFVPDSGVRRALLAAVDRGVRVRLLLPARGDVAAVQFAAESLYDAFLRRGVHIYALAGPILHSKTAIVDDEFCTIGSYNLDHRSWRKNLEVNLAVEDAAFARHVRTWFDRDVARAVPVDLATWRERSRIKKGLEQVAFALRKLW